MSNPSNPSELARLEEEQELRDRVDASRDNPDGPHEDEDALLARAEQLSGRGILSTPGIASTEAAGPLEVEDLITAIQTITDRLDGMIPPAGSNARGPRVPPRTQRKRRRTEVNASRKINR